MARIENIDKVIASLKRLQAKRAPEAKVSVVVGYQTVYALALHENIEMKWRGLPRDRSVRLDKSGIVRTGYTPQKGKFGLFWGPQGGAKFLERPAREGQSRIKEIVLGVVKAGKTVGDGLMVAGLWLQRMSQMVVPVEHDVLRSSAFTKRESL